MIALVRLDVRGYVELPRQQSRRLFELLSVYMEQAVVRMSCPMQIDSTQRRCTCTDLDHRV